jgi:hypothetical protein
MRRFQPRSLVALFTLAMSIGPRPAGAAPPPPTTGAPSPEIVQRADALFQKGNQLYSEKKWADAEQALLAAWALNPTFDVASNLGNTQYQLGKHREAAEHLAFALRHWPLIGRPALRQTAQKRLDECRQHVGALVIKVSVARAEVFVDGKRVGTAPLEGEVFVEPGERTVEAKLDGYEHARQVVQVEKGAAAAIDLTLGASALGAGPAATSNSEGARPPPVMPVAPGPRKEVLIAGGATAGAALVVGVVFTVLANGKANDANQKHDAIAKAGGERACGSTPFAADCMALHGLRQDAYTFTNVAGWAFIGAGVVGTGTLIYALVAPRKESTPRLQAAPVITGHGGGLWMTGRW